MGTEFFDELGETLTRTAKGLGERAELIYESQKLRNKISSEDRVIDKIMADLGNILYKSYVSGAEPEENQKALCVQIDQHFEQIAKYKEALANLRGRKICPSCQEAVDKTVSFCPHCGAACPTSEPEEDAGEVVEAPEETMEETMEEASPAAEDAAETVEETMEAVEEAEEEE